jgi:hypothetical protein
VSHYFVQPRRSNALSGDHWISRWLVRLFARRRRRPSADHLAEHLLRDAGLDRIGGRTIRRRR